MYVWLCAADEMVRCSVAILRQNIPYQFISVACATDRACHVSSLQCGSSTRVQQPQSGAGICTHRVCWCQRVSSSIQCFKSAGQSDDAKYLQILQFRNPFIVQKGQKDVCCCKTFVVAPLSRSFFFVHILHAFLSLYRFKTCVTPRTWTGL